MEYNKEINNKITATFNDRTIIKVGNSLAITLPETEVKKQNLGLGAVVDVELTCEFETVDLAEIEDEIYDVETFIEIVKETKDIGIINRVAIMNDLKSIGFKELESEKLKTQYKKDILQELENSKKDLEKYYEENDFDNSDLPDRNEFDANSNPELLK